MAPCRLKVTALTFGVLSLLFFLSWTNEAPLSGATTVRILCLAYFCLHPQKQKGKQDRNMTFMTYLHLEVHQNRSSEMLVSTATVAA